MKSYNAVDFKGRLYTYAIEEVETDKGTALSGEVTLEVDLEGTTVSAKYFCYPVFNSGKKNSTYTVLEGMVNGDYKTVVDNGDDADWLAFSGTVDSSYFVSKNSTDGEITRAQKIRGSFINGNKEKKYANKWTIDLLITSIQDVEADPEKHLSRFLRVKGFYVDDYNKRVMEVQFQVRAEKAMDYISGLEASINSPYFVSTWGKIEKIKRSVVRKNAFGDDEVEEYNSIQWTITGMKPDAYPFGDESAIAIETYQEFRDNLAAHIEEKKNQNNESDGGGNGKPDLAF